jgi:hypothetical protein
MVTVFNHPVPTRKIQNFNSTKNFQTNFPSKAKGLLLRKRHPLLPEINRVIEEEAVTFMLIYRKYFHSKPSKCNELSYKPKALRKLLFLNRVFMLCGNMELKF